MPLLRLRPGLGALAACAMTAGVICGATPAHATAPGNDPITNATSVDLSGQTASASLFPNNSAATAADSSADGALSGSEGTASHTLWYKFQPAPGRVTVTIQSTASAHAVVGVVTTTTADAVLDGTADEFDVISAGNVTNSDGAEGSQTLAVTDPTDPTPAFTFSVDRQFVPDAQHFYYLGVGTIGTDTGVTHLTVDYTQAPDNDDFASAAPLSTSTLNYHGDTTAATPDLDAGGANTDPVVGQPSMFSVWYAFTPGTSGQASISTATSAFPVVFDVCQSLLATAADCAKPSHTVVSSANGAGAPFTSASFDVVAGESYYVFLDGQQVSGQQYNASGLYTLKFTFAPGPPNDDISSPKVLKPSGIDRAKGTNVRAQALAVGANPPTTIRTESSLGLSFNSGAQHTVFYRYRPAKSGRRVVYTTGSLDTDVAVFTGSVAGGFTKTKFGNDDYSSSDPGSRFVLPVKKGKTYTIAVDGSHKVVYPQGTFSLNVGGVPANDNLSGAKLLAKSKAKIGTTKTTVSKATGKVSGSTDFATFQKGEKSPNGHTGGASAWYEFIAPKAGKYTFTERIAHQRALLAAYSGKGKNLGLKLIHSAGSAKSSAGTKITIRAKAGQHFAVSVDGVGGEFGKYTLSWR